MSATPAFASTIAFLALCYAFTFTLSLFRFYLLRNRKRSTLFRISDGLQILFLVEALVCGVLITYQIIDIELFARTAETQMDIVHYMFSKKHMKLYYVEASGFVIILWTVKASFVALYWALVKRLTWTMKGVLCLLTSLLVVTGTVNLGLFLGWCRPLPLNWSVETKACTPPTVNPGIVATLFTSNAVTHVLVMIFPLGLLPSYRITRGQLYGLFFMAFCGFTGLSMIILRYAIMRSLIFIENERPAYVRYQQVLGITELVAVNIAFCVPAYRGPLSRLFTRQRWVKSKHQSMFEQLDSSKHLEINVTRELEIDVYISRHSEDSAQGALRALGLLGLGIGKGYKAEAVAGSAETEEGSVKGDQYKMDTFS